MAVSTTFKIQCPSCEAMIKVKDSLIGKKVECTKCKDKFVAERPDDDFEDDAPQVKSSAKPDKSAAKRDTKLNGKSKTPPPKNKDTGVTAKAPLPGKKRTKLAVEDDIDDLEVEVDEHASNGKAGKNKAEANGKANGKLKKGREDEDIDDDLDEGDIKTKKKKVKAGASSSNKLIWGLGFAVLGVIVLVATLIVVMNMGGGGGGGGGNQANKGGMNPNPVQNVNQEDKKKDPPGNNLPAPPVKPTASPLTDAELARLSNLLPEKTEHVFRIFFKNLLDPTGPLRESAFVTRRNGQVERGAGTLDDDELRKSLGFSVLAIDDMICAEKFTAPAWKYTVIHFNEVINEDQLKKKLNLELVKLDKGNVYRTANPHPWFDQLANVSFGVPNSLRVADARANRGTYIRIHNAQTMIVGDEIPVKELVTKGAYQPKPPVKKDPPVNPGGMVGGNPPLIPPGGMVGGNPPLVPPGGMVGGNPPLVPPGGMVGGNPPVVPPGGMVGGNPPVVPPGGMVGGNPMPSGPPKGAMAPADREIIRFAFQQPGPSGGIGGPKPLPGGGAGGAGGLQPLPPMGALGAGGGGPMPIPNTGAMGAGGAVGLGGAVGQGGALGQGGGVPQPPPPPQRDDCYMTINPSLKAILDRMESRGPTDKDKVLFSSATDMTLNVIDTGKDQVVRRPRQFWDVTLLLTERKVRIRTLGTAFVQKDGAGSKFQLRNEIGCTDTVFAQEFEKELMDRTAFNVAKFIQALTITRERPLGHEIKLPEKEKPAPPVNPGPGPGPGPIGPGPGPIGPGVGPGPGPIGPGVGPGPGPIGPGVGPIGPGPGPGPIQPPKEEKKPAEVTESRITLHQDRSTVDFVLDLVLNNKDRTYIESVATLYSSSLRVDMEAAAQVSLRHTLAKAGKNLGENGLSQAGIPKGQLPPGAFVRDGVYTDREPRNRISWMAGLLPYLGHQNLYSEIKFNQSWRHPDNWLAGGTIVPQFLDPMYPDHTRFVSYGDLPMDFAATHFVGVAGVGRNAAAYRPGDPATEHKRGPLSYDGSASLAEIQAGRGASNVMLMIQVPHDRGVGATPWIAGGGYTLRGLSEEQHPMVDFMLQKDKNDKSIQHQNKKGTYVLMVDGTVRFVDQNVSPEVFRAMATIKGPNPPKYDIEADPMTPAVPPPEDNVKPPVDKAMDPAKLALQGVWGVKSAEKDGQVLPAELLKTMVFTFQGDNVTVSGIPGAPDSNDSYTLDPAKSPKQIIVKDGATQKLSYGIYELKGDELKICIRDDDSKKGFPTAFATAPKAELQMLVLTRKSAPKIQTPAQK